MQNFLSNKVKIFLALISTSLIFSCVSQKNLAPYVDYSDSVSLKYEISKAESFLEKDSLETIFRAYALKNNASNDLEIDDLITRAKEKVLIDFNSSIEEKNWSKALVFSKSLESLNIDVGEWEKNKILSKQNQAWEDEENFTLSNLNLVKKTENELAPSVNSVSKMIQGTVTIWVDRGISIKDGVGYADRGIGSGFFIDQRGYLITNYHVIESEVNPKYDGYSRLFIKTADSPEYRIPAKVIGWDTVLDLALLKTEIDPTVVFTLGSSEDLKVGNRIYAIGSPAGLEQTLTSGIVSAQKRRFLSLGDILQIDAPINHGNSGGPIIDELGRVQAVVFAGIKPFEGLNFAIPVEYLRLILPRLYEGGLVKHSWVSSLGKTTTLEGSTEKFGVEVLYTLGSGAMDIAGIKKGTIITSANGIRVRSIEELQSTIIKERPGTIIKFEGIPSEKAKNASYDDYEKEEWLVRLKERPEMPSNIVFNSDLQSNALLPVFGLDLEPVGKTKRFLVKRVIKASAADESGFSENDVVEIKKVVLDEKNNMVIIHLYAKKRKGGYLESYIGLAASMDSPFYF